MHPFLISTIIVFSLSLSFGNNYCFPSSNPPAGKKASELKQFITLVFDSVTFSGEKGTLYEYKEGNIPWHERATVGGKDHNGVTSNPLNIQEGDIGLSWTVKTLAGQRKNPDNSEISFTYFPLAGAMIPTWGPSVMEQQSKFGSYNDPTHPFVDDGFVIRPVAWGREHKVSLFEDSLIYIPDYIIQGNKKAINSGHEFGNGTLDGIESSSPLPIDFFYQWHSEAGGFDPGWDTLGDSTLFEIDHFAIGTYYKDHGWIMFAGNQIEKDTWKGAINLSEEQLKIFLNNFKSSSGFRAPRLEVNSSLFFALSDLGFLYDCSLIEGEDDYFDGTNFIWPYTLDNGSPNSWTIKKRGMKNFLDSLPTSLWQYPLSPLIVPEDIRGKVWSNRKINAEIIDGEKYTEQDSLNWIKNGKILATDYDLFIKWGMYPENAFKTLKHTLDLRLEGNKAPMQISCNPDHFTPNYDFKKLLSNHAIPKISVAVMYNWNTWINRKEVIENFVDYSLKKGAHFKSAKDAIEEIKKMQQDETYGNEQPYHSIPSKSFSWFFQCNSNLNSSTETKVFNDHIIEAKMIVDKAKGQEFPFASYASYQNCGNFEGLDHISFTYKSTAPLKFKILVNGDKPWEILLNNINKEVYSGKIPIDAFHYSLEDMGKNVKINTEDVVGFEIQPLTNYDKVEEVHFSLYDIRLNGTTEFEIPHSITNSKLNENFISPNIKCFNPTQILLNFPHKGHYKIEIISGNGRKVEQLSNNNLKLFSAKLNNLAKGIYFIRITEIYQNSISTIRSFIL